MVCPVSLSEHYKGFRIQYGKWIHFEKPISSMKRFEPLSETLPKGNPIAA